MKETDIETFWQAHPCGDQFVGGLHGEFSGDYEGFFAAYDAWRYSQESHIPETLDRFEWRGRSVLEIGLGQGAESEQLIRRGARWSGLDLTAESVERVRARLTVRNLPHEQLKQGSALAIPYPDDTFDVVFSHGVLHHIPDITTAQSEIHRVLRPGGTLVAMVYARRSVNFQVSVRLVRRALLAAAYPFRGTAPVTRSRLLSEHLAGAERIGLHRYLNLETFTHRNTDGPGNPFSRVYSPREVRRDFPDFELLDSFQRYSHAPPLPVRGLPFGERFGWHLWARMRARP